MHIYKVSPKERNSEDCFEKDLRTLDPLNELLRSRVVQVEKFCFKYRGSKVKIFSTNLKYAMEKQICIFFHLENLKESFSQEKFL